MDYSHCIRRGLRTETRRRTKRKMVSQSGVANRNCRNALAVGFRTEIGKCFDKLELRTELTARFAKSNLQTGIANRLLRTKFANELCEWNLKRTCANCLLDRFDQAVIRPLVWLVRQ